MSSKKKNRLVCEKCGTQFRSKEKKKEECGECSSPKWVVIPEDKMSEKNILVDN